MFQKVNKRAGAGSDHRGLYSATNEKRARQGGMRWIGGYWETARKHYEFGGEHFAKRRATSSTPDVGSTARRCKPDDRDVSRSAGVGHAAGCTSTAFGRPAKRRSRMRSRRYSATRHANTTKLNGKLLAFVCRESSARVAERRESPPPALIEHRRRAASAAHFAASGCRPTTV